MPQQRMPAWLVTDLTVIVVGLAIISVAVWIARSTNLHRPLLGGGRMTLLIDPNQSAGSEPSLS